MNFWNKWVFVRLAGKPKARILEVQVRHSWRHVRTRDRRLHRDDGQDKEEQEIARCRQVRALAGYKSHSGQCHDCNPAQEQK